MTVRTCTCTEVPADGGDVSYLLAWTGLVNGDNGAPFDITSFVPLTAQVEGTFGSGGSVAIEGSNDGTNYRALHDQGGTTIAITAAGIKTVGDCTRYAQPHVTAGDGTTSLTVTMLIRKARAR